MGGLNLTPEQLKFRDEEIQYWKLKGTTWSDALGEKIRTLVIGTLAVIWAIFTGEQKGIIHSTHNSTAALCLIALLALIVLALDFTEHIMGYNEAMQRTDEKVFWPKGNFKRWRRYVRETKMALGLITLTSLATVLAFVTFFSVFPAYGSDNLGHKWCGPDVNKENYMVLDITTDQSAIKVKFLGEPCENAGKLTEGHYYASCRAAFLDNMWSQGDLLYVIWHYTTDPDKPRTSVLQQCDH